MPVRTKRLWGPTATGLAAPALYTCPPGETALIKHISAYNQNIATQVLYLFLNNVGSANLIFASEVPAGRATQFHPLFFVLHPGDTLRGYGLTGDMNVAGFGAELVGVA